MANMDVKKFEERTHILVIDDDERLRDLLSRFLKEQDFLVTTASDTREAREILGYLAYDIIVCDVMMPGEDGLQFTRSLKEQRIQTPVLLLTALGEIDARISGLEAGADDYLPKPFEPKELLLRLQAILRRVQQTLPSKNAVKEITLGKWVIDLERGDLHDGDARMSLTSVEHALLKALASRAGEVISREELATLCQMSANERTIDVQVTRLRKKVEEDPKLPKFIQTVRGKGYILWTDG